MKKRIITLVLSALALVLLVGVGFASWVISQGSESVQTGNILVETVVDQRVKVVYDFDSDFQFGAPETTLSTAWLRENGEDVISENLVVVCTVTVTRPTAFKLDAVSGQPTDLSISAELLDKILDADNNEVAYPTAFFDRKDGANVTIADTWTLSNSNKTAETTITIELKWGSLFNYQNPYTYFNAHEVSDPIGDAPTAGLTLPVEPTFGDLALAALQEVYKYNSYKFQLSVVIGE